MPCAASMKAPSALMELPSQDLDSTGAPDFGPGACRCPLRLRQDSLTFRLRVMKTRLIFKIPRVVGVVSFADDTQRMHAKSYGIRKGRSPTCLCRNDSFNGGLESRQDAYGLLWGLSGFLHAQSIRTDALRLY